MSFARMVPAAGVEPATY